MPSLNVAFVVQGEGRGHMTQALALAPLLRDAGHEVTSVMVGKSPWRSVPDYFKAGIGVPVEEFDAPTQVPDRDGLGVSVSGTVVDAARRAPAFARSMARIADLTGEADVVVNFLDLMAGLAGTFHPSDIPVLAVAHNYVFLHPDMSAAPGPQHVRRSVLAYARATAANARHVMALSFDELPSRPEIKLEVAPPLLRPTWTSLESERGDYLLAYALNAGYGTKLASWASANPEVRVHCYVDGGAGALPEATPESFQAHDLDEYAFLRHLAGCRAYVGSAGFESICEAFALGKPVLAVPTKGQFEQTLNAWDAARYGAARAGSYDDLDDFWKNPQIPDAGAVTRFRGWLTRAPEIFVDAVERTAHTVSGE